MWKRLVSFCLATVLLAGTFLGLCFNASAAENANIPMNSIRYNYVNYGTNMTSSVYFGTEVLLTDARVFSGELAKMSAALAVAAYSRTSINDLLDQMGFSCYDNTAVYDRSANELTIYDNDYVAYTVGCQSVIHPASGEEYLIYCVPIQGTPANAEWFSDFNMGTGTEHEGFSKASREVYNVLQSYFAEDGMDADHRIIWLTGHSRGAACANLIAGWLSQDSEVNTLPEHVFGYTYACPAVSLAADTTLTNIYNFNNIGDMVTLLPMSEWGYLRYGQTITLDTSEQQLRNFRQQFQNTTCWIYAGETTDANYRSLLINIIGTDRDVYYDSPALQAVLGVGAWALGGKNNASIWEVLAMYLVLPNIPLNSDVKSPAEALSVLEAAYEEQEALVHWSDSAYKETANMEVDEFEPYLSDNSEMVSKLESRSSIRIQNARSFLTAGKVLETNQSTIETVAECIAAAAMLFLDEDGNVTDKIVHGHTQSTYLIWINSLFFGYRGWYGSNIIASASIDGSCLSIGTECFDGCASLTEVIFPASLNTIGEYAFRNCGNLKQAEFIGAAPAIAPESFAGTSAVCYYPSQDDSWTADTMQNYGGLLSWVVRSDAPEIASGWSGDTQWVLTADGVLTVFGIGNMKDYGYSREQPWQEYQDQIKAVVISNGVTAVGSGAFMGLTGLEKVALPESGLTRIGEAAFYGCSSLKEISIPEGVYTIWAYTFKNCTALNKIKLPRTLIKIDQGAFENCASLPYLFLPTNLNIIGSWSFKGCTSLTEVDMTWVDATEVREGAFKNCSALTTVRFPNDIQKLGDSAFYGIGATSLTVPATVAEVGPWCFARAYDLTQLHFIGDAPVIGEGAFNKITVTVFYPMDNNTWMPDFMQDYGGTVTWKSN